MTDWVAGTTWIGAAKYNGVWVWRGMTTDDINIDIWNQGQPDNFNSVEDCALSHKFFNYLMNDSSCAKFYKFICETDKKN